MLRKNAKISALSSGKLDKYEYLTGEDLGCRPDPVQEAKFEYSPLGQVFNKGLETDEKQEGLLKRLKNIENKTDNQLDLIRDQGDRQLDSICYFNVGRKSIGFENQRLSKLKKETDDKENDIIDNRKSEKQEERDKVVFNFTATDKTPFYFSDYTVLMKFAQNIYTEKLSFEKAREKQDQMLTKLNESEKRVNSKSSRLMIKIEKKMKILAENARGLYNFRNKIIDEIEKETGEESKEDRKIEELRLHRPEEELAKLIKDVKEDIDLDEDNNIKSKKSNLLEFLNSIKNTKINDKTNATSNYLKFLNYKESLGRTQDGSRADRTKNFINGAEFIIFGPLFNSKQESEKLDIATGGYDEYEAMRELENEKQNKTKKRQKGYGLKIMTPSQLLTRLPILLAQKQAGNNSQQLNNEIRQIIYSLYRSKNLSKTLYNHLINSI